MSKRFHKDPDAVLDYQVDWAEWLGTDTITASTWTVDAGVVKDSDTFTSTTATIWVSGGTAGSVHKAVNHITTAGGRQDDRTVELKGKEK